MSVKRGRPPKEIPIEIASEIPFVSANIRPAGHVFKMIVTPTGWPNEMASAMADMSRFQKFLECGIFIKLDKSKNG